MLELTRQAMAGQAAVPASADAPVAKQAGTESVHALSFSHSLEQAEQVLESADAIDAIDAMDAWLLDPTLETPLPAEPVLPAQLIESQRVAEQTLRAPDTAEDLAEQWLQGMLSQRQVILGAQEQPAMQPVIASPALTLPALPRQLSQTPLENAPVAPHALRPQAATAFESEPQATPVTQEMPKASSAALAAPLLAAVEGLSLREASALVSAAPDAPLLSHVQSAGAVHSAPRLPVEAPQMRFGEQILQTLRQSIEVQVRQNIQQATVRLDPPELGSLEIFLSHESGRLQIHIHAANADVSRLLQQTSERLRQDLVSANYLQVNVQVGSEGQSGRQQQRQAPSGPDAVIAQAATFDEQAREQVTGDVLVTV